MTRDTVLATLKARESELARFGVRSLALFGSVARNEATPRSDVDLLVEFDRPVGMFGLLRLQQYLQELLGCDVDVGTPDSLKPRIRSRVLAEAIHVA